jgi:hypothetical protein
MELGIRLSFVKISGRGVLIAPPQTSLLTPLVLGNFLLELYANSVHSCLVQATDITPSQPVPLLHLQHSFNNQSVNFCYTNIFGIVSTIALHRQRNFRSSYSSCKDHSEQSILIDIILPAALWPLELTQSLTEMSTRNISWG